MFPTIQNYFRSPIGKDRGKHRWLSVVILAFLWTAVPLSAQGTAAVPLPRLTGAVTLDGLSDEAAWEDITPLPLVMSSPTYLDTPTERTEIRIAYDDDFIYAAGRFYDSDPSGIHGNALERDGMTPAEDGFGVILDTFNDNENALGFVTNPAGMRVDWAIYNDAESDEGFPINSSWNTFWDVAVVRTEEGWFAEMRIPFSSLRFQDNDGQVVMGLLTWRYIARKNETISYPPIDPKWNWGFLKPSISQDIVLEGIFSRSPVYVTPYVLGGLGREQVLNNSGSDYQLNNQNKQSGGLDVKYGLTSNLTLDLTLNTDFAQVETDEVQINLTRFSLFFPEKRLFFQERSSVFDFRTGGPNRLFYSRNIGLYDIGDDDFRSVPIIGGIRLVGRIGNWDLGALDMQTAQATFHPGEGDTVRVPSENFGVLRLRRQVFNENSYLGGMLTSRIDRNGGYNYGLGLDGTVRVVGDDYLIFNWAQTIDSDYQSTVSTLDAGRIRLDWDNRGNAGFGYNFGFSRSGPDYLPRMGFETRHDYFRLGNNISYSWMPGKDSPTYRHTLLLEFSTFYRNSDRALESLEAGPAWDYTSKAGAFGKAWAKGLYEDLPDILELPEATHVPPGQYRFYDIGGYYQTPMGRLLRTGIFATTGPFYDGWQLAMGANPEWTVSPHLSLSGSYNFSSGWFPDRDQTFTVHLLGLRAKVAFSTRLSISAFVQSNSADHEVGVNLRLRYNPREGTDLYLVYNDLLNTDRERGQPALPLFSERTLLLKYSTTFLR